MTNTLAYAPHKGHFAQLRKGLPVAEFKISDVKNSNDFHKAREHLSPDLIIVDVSFPDSDGMQIARELRNAKGNMPVLLYVPLKNPGEVVKALKLSEAPMNFDFVIEGAGRDETVARMRRLLQRALPQAAMSHKSNRVKRGLGHLVSQIHGESGRIDANRVALLMGIPFARMARVLGRLPATVHKTPDAESLQRKLAVFEQMIAGLLHLMGSEKGLRAWLNAPHPELDRSTPASVIKAGEAEVIAALVEDMLLGQPA